uniref:C2H2-type domain-containing protein n=1 Tax=Panagrellus redivivus TaxID=6233 RepID=A0A7E4W251_PANRE
MLNEHHTDETHHDSEDAHDLIPALLWVNKTAKVDYTHVEQLGRGDVYCQLLADIYSEHIGVDDMEVVKTGSGNDMDWIQHWALVRKILASARVEKHIPKTLLKMEFRDNHRFLLWFKRHYISVATQREQQKYIAAQKPQHQMHLTAIQSRCQLLRRFSKADLPPVPKKTFSFTLMDTNVEPKLLSSIPLVYEPGFLHVEKRGNNNYSDIGAVIITDDRFVFIDTRIWLSCLLVELRVTFRNKNVIKLSLARVPDTFVMVFNMSADKIADTILRLQRHLVSTSSRKAASHPNELHKDSVSVGNNVNKTIDAAESCTANKNYCKTFERREFEPHNGEGKDDVLICGECQFRTNDLNDFAEHRSRECYSDDHPPTEPTSIQCFTCDDTFAFSWNLLQHLIEKHSLDLYRQDDGEAVERRGPRTPSSLPPEDEPINGSGPRTPPPKNEPDAPAIQDESIAQDLQRARTPPLEEEAYDADAPSPQPPSPEEDEAV